MPGGDGTGPVGMGPMTGRAAGYCAGYAAPGYMNVMPGGRLGGRGGGRGRRNWFYATGLTGWQRAARGLPVFGRGGAYPASFAEPYAPAGVNTAREVDLLRQQVEYVTGAIEDLKRRIEELQQPSQEK